MPGPVPRHWRMLPPLILITTLGDMHEYYPHFTVRGTEFTVVNQLVGGHKVKWHSWAMQPCSPDPQC